MTKTFAHLHVHTECSLLDGQSPIPRLVKTAAEMGMPALAITDHGNMMGAIEFYKACRQRGIKPIIGTEGYIVDDIAVRPSKMGEYNHLLLLARDYEGYQNLLKLTTAAWTRGFHYRPRIDKTLLAAHSRGLIATSGCLAGEIPQLIMAGKLDEARQVAGWYHEVFGENFFIEVQDHETGEDSDQMRVNPHLFDLARYTGTRLLATNDLHYVGRQDADVQDVMLCIQTGKLRTDEKRMRFDGPHYYLKSADEMYALFAGYEEACDNTLLVAEMCDLDIPFGGSHIPEFAPPAGYASDADYLYALCLDGIRERYGDVTPTHRDRLDREFAVIRSSGFVPYFLIVHDYVNYGRERGMRCVARGSVAGSIAAYALGISNVDPLYYDIMFERFLNPERRSMPDIDIDLPDDRRDEVIAYVANKYGWDKVAQIVTHNVMATKMAIRDVGRVLGEQELADRLARMVPNNTRLFPYVNGAKPEAEAVLKTFAPALYDLYTADVRVRRIMDFARELEGTTRNTGVHAAGVIISRTPLVELVPCQLRDQKAGPDSGWLLAQYEQGDLEELGLLKMDFLGLSNLTILQRTQQLVKESLGVDVDLDRIPRDDPETMRMLAEGKTTGVFQLESGPMRAWIKELKPSRVQDIQALVALYRPGPMDQIPRYVGAKHGKLKPTYPHARLEPILRDTYGVLVYQDQVLLAARELAGFSWAEVDAFRKAMGKKIPEKMQEQKAKFLRGCADNGIAPDVALDVWAFIEPFSGYGFNKAHACSYGWVSYQTAYMKAHYPDQFMCATLTKEAGDAAKVNHIIAECKRMGVTVRSPDVNRSQAGFTLERDGDTGRFAVRFGLLGIKGVGEKQAAAMLAERQAHGPYRNIADLFARCPGRAVTSGTVKALIQAGACDGFSTNRAAQLASIEAAQKLGKKTKEREVRPWEAAAVAAFALTADVEPETEDQRLMWEYELLGFYLSAHPLDRFGDALEAEASVLISDIADEMADTEVTVAGRLANVRAMQTKANKQDMAVVVIEDRHGSLDAVVFPGVYEQSRSVCQQNRVVVVRGMLRRKEIGSGLQLVVSEMTLFREQVKKPAPVASDAVVGVDIVSKGGLADVRAMQAIAKVWPQHPGIDRYRVTLVKGASRQVVAEGHGVHAGDDLTDAIRAAVPDAVVAREKVAVTS